MSRRWRGETGSRESGHHRIRAVDAVESRHGFARCVRRGSCGGADREDLSPAGTRAIARELTTLYAVVRDNVETLYAAVAAGFEGAASPPFVRREFDGYLDSGLLSRGFARMKFEARPAQHLAASSCYPQRETMRSWAPSAGLTRSRLSAPAWSQPRTA